MLSVFTGKNLKLLLLLAGFAVQPVMSQASTLYLLDAVVNDDWYGSGSFGIVFDDIDNDGLFSIDELTYFSGIWTLTSANGYELRHNLITTPDIAGVSICSGTGSFSQSWCDTSFLIDDFRRGTGLATAAIGYGHYDISISPFAAGASAPFAATPIVRPVPPAVPVPASLPLLAAGLFGLGLLRKARK